MARARIKITKDQITPFINKLGLKDKTRDVHKIMMGFGFRSIQDHFKKEEGPDGPWAPLALSTLRRRPSGRKKLQITGRLRQSFAIGNVKGGNNPSVEIVNTIPWSNVHDQGGRAGRNHAAKIPARPFMWLDDDTFESMFNEIFGLMGV